MVHKDWLQGEQGDASGIAGKAEAVLVDPSCSNSGTLDPSWSRTRSDASADGAEMEAEGFAGSGVHGGKGGAYVGRGRGGEREGERLRRLASFQERALLHAFSFPKVVGVASWGLEVEVLGLGLRVRGLGFVLWRSRPQCARKYRC